MLCLVWLWWFILQAGSKRCLLLEGPRWSIAVLVFCWKVQRFMAIDALDHCANCGKTGAPAVWEPSCNPVVDGRDGRRKRPGYEWLHGCSCRSVILCYLACSCMCEVCSKCKVAHYCGATLSADQWKKLKEARFGMPENLKHRQKSAIQASIGFQPKRHFNSSGVFNAKVPNANEQIGFHIERPAAPSRRRHHQCVGAWWCFSQRAEKDVGFQAVEFTMSIYRVGGIEGNSTKPDHGSFQKSFGWLGPIG